ncbi:acyl carrier protein [bacterium]|nr:acyl carrier protein [bacterium]
MIDPRKIEDLVAEVLHVPRSDVGPDRRLCDIADLDSLSLVEIASAVDDAFGVRVPGDGLTAILTVSELVDLVARAPAR